MSVGDILIVIGGVSLVIVIATRVPSYPKSDAARIQTLDGEKYICTKVEK